MKVLFKKFSPTRLILVADDQTDEDYLYHLVNKITPWFVPGHDIYFIDSEGKHD